MNKNRKITIIGCCIALALTMFLFIINSGMKLKYDMKARSIAESVRKIKADEFKKYGVKISRLKYGYTIYNADTDMYNVVYYAKWIEEEDPNWFFVRVELISSKLIFVDVDDSNDYAGEKEKTIKKIISSPSSSDGKKSKWIRVDRIKFHSVINTFLWTAFYLILIMLFLINKSSIKRLFDTIYKKILIKNGKSDKSLIENSNNNITKLEELSQMLNMGLITDEEFQSKKMDILEKM